MAVPVIQSFYEPTEKGYMLEDAAAGDLWDGEHVFATREEADLPPKSRRRQPTRKSSAMAGPWSSPEPAALSLLWT